MTLNYLNCDNSNFLPRESFNSYKPVFKVENGCNILKISFWQNGCDKQNAFYYRSTYIEKFWLSILGPSATWILRLLLDEIKTNDPITVMTSNYIASQVGLSDNTSKNSPLCRSIRRLLDFRIAKQIKEGHLVISKYIPPLSTRQTLKLPSSMLELHKKYLILLQNGYYDELLGDDRFQDIEINLLLNLKDS